MQPNLRLLSLLGILGLTFVSLTGCGEKRVHVATASGAPGEELTLVPVAPLPENSEDPASPGLSNLFIDESGLASKIPESPTTSEDLTTPSSTQEPISFTHEPSSLSSQEESADSPASDVVTSPEPSSLPLANTATVEAETDLSDTAKPLVALADTSKTEPETEISNNGTSSSLKEGQSISAQPSSSPSDQPAPALTNVTEHPKPTTPISSADLEDTLLQEGLEQIPETFQIAKAEPSDSLQERINQIRKAELAAASAGLLDVFFQFDSWALTEDGKQSLKQTLGWFEQNPTSNLIIEGHADQRGTQAYNMVLAKKRAVAVQDFLTQLGIATSRLTVISYGKDKPFCQDNTEVCHQLNRRGHLLISNQ